MRFLAVVCMMLLSACAPRHAPEQPRVDNPWQMKAESLARSGVAAMDRERWGLARSMFERSLQAATLAGDRQLMALDWYNLGRAKAAGGDVDAARRAYERAAEQAGESGDAVNEMRASLALALLQSGDIPNPGGMPEVPAAYPIDIHLAAARLAALRGRADAARRAYAQVLGKAGKDRTGLLYAARAHLGLAELEAGGDAWPHLNAAMALLRRAGQPHLMLRALHLAASLETDAERRRAWEQRQEMLRKALDASHAE